MKLEDTICVVTGAGRGVGRALCREFKKRGAAGIAVLDLDGAQAAATAAELGGLGIACDVSDETAIRAAVDQVNRRYGRIDVWVSNAGFGCTDLDLDDAFSADNGRWQRMWDVHVMSHVYAGRAVVPGMLERGRGHLVNTASAAGLLSQVGDTPYTATKHAAVALADSIAITYGDRGINVSVICPQYIATALTGLDESTAPGQVEGVLTVQQAASAIADGIEANRYLILPHPEVAGFVQKQAADRDRWVGGMRRLRESLRAGTFLKLKAK
jgi:NAD(P)-dependent dehydrogenase (short-subunit alcohol dehydrogenase family)